MGEIKREAGKETSWLRGAMVLGVSALFSKVLGTIQKIPLQNVAGDRVFGIYNAVYPFYQLLLFLATSGIPVAVSLLVAQRMEADDQEGMRRVLRTGMLLLGLTGAASFVLMWTGAELAADWIGDRDTAAAIRMAALALWFVPVTGALRGYFQGQQQMVPSAVSQIAEQTFRVAAMLVLLMVGMSAGWPQSHVAAGAMAGSAAGGAAGLLVMLVFWRRSDKLGRTKADPCGGKGPAQHSDRRLLRNMAKLALPVALGSVAVPIVGLVDAVTVPRLLRPGSAAEADVMTLFGLYSRGQPLVQLVVMVAGAAAAALVPALAVARARGDMASLSQRTELALRFAWWIGAAAAVGLVLLAESINVMLYADNEQTLTFMLIGCTATAGTLNAVTAALLQGHGAVRLPVAILLFAALLKVALNAALVPAHGIVGAAYAGIAAFSAAALLGVAATCRAAGVRLPARRYAACSGLALACMAAALMLAERGTAALLGPLSLPPRAAATVLALTGAAVGAAVFAAALLRCGGISARELRALPGGAALAARLRRWRLLPADE
ncbi:polysaccharide biosynthesis protein [Paenibacillus abyssi]|nr:polysaccharide biosynthesis protein [Paenibacillus abyssi]